MKEVILKATDGTEIKLNINKTLVGYPYIERIDIIEPKPEFKVPGWYKYKEVPPNLIFYATSKANGFFYSDVDESHLINNCRPATQMEIESHLRGEAEERGFKNGVTYKYPKHISISNRVVNEPLYYSVDMQGLHDSSHNLIWNIYDGWAEVVPGKKKLPCTKAEIRALILKLHRIITTGKYPVGEQWTVDNFLKDYED